MNAQSWKIHITGVVQSVGFRPFVKNLADMLSITGSIKNMGGSGVEIIAHVKDTSLDMFVSQIEEQAPRHASIQSIKFERSPVSSTSSFDILPSTGAPGGIVAIPADIGICSECVADYSREKTPRRAYSFISCTNCGPRYSVIKNLPYDRERTSFGTFPLCTSCQDEYDNPKDRRYHAQTTVCSVCGPNYRSHMGFTPWKDWKEVIESGGIVAILSQSGSFLVCDARSDNSIAQLRVIRKRKNKPFAIMVRDLQTAERYVELTDQDRQELNSYRRPIVILPKKRGLSGLISPHLHTIGIMLPYTSLHSHLFATSILDALVMTSANDRGQPMITTPDLLSSYGENRVDLTLIHNLDITQRVDDSVIQSHEDHHHIIRRSRGYVPEPLFLPDGLHARPSIALGAEEMNTVSLASDNLVIPSQHLGHIVNTENLDAHEHALNHLLELFPLNIEEVMVDRHPNFLNRITAQNIVDQTDARLIEIQHHAAHSASLALDHQVNGPLLSWAIDGYGLGDNREAWGGELLLLDRGYQRLGHLEPMRYSGGDINAKYPDRMLFLLSEGRLQKQWKLKHGASELSYLKKSLNKPAAMITTSTGRYLDAMASLYDICHFQTYRGEPAIRFGDRARLQHSSEPAQIFLKGSMIASHDLLDYCIAHSPNERFVLESLAISMAELSRQVAEREGLSQVGLSGGVAYNYVLCHSFCNYLKNSGLEALTHKSIPAGDGGISPGQIYYRIRYGED